jgi:hypothetical protein
LHSAAPTPSDWRRGFLRSVAWDAADAAPVIALESQLKAVCRAKIAASADGKTLISFAANGHQYQYETAKGMRPEAVAAFTSWLYDLYVESRAVLVEAGDASPTDAEILDRMLTAVVPVHAVLIDRSEVQR